MTVLYVAVEGGRVGGLLVDVERIIWNVRHSCKVKTFTRTGGTTATMLEGARERSTYYETFVPISSQHSEEVADDTVLDEDHLPRSGNFRRYCQSTTSQISPSRLQPSTCTMLSHVPLPLYHREN